MKKNDKLFWRYFGTAMVVLEVFVYLLFIRNPFPWQFVRVAFLLVNALIIAHLVQVKLKVQRHNAQVSAAYQAKKTALIKLPKIRLFSSNVSQSGRA